MKASECEKHPLIVGIGASAGGLAAFKSFLANTPGDSGMGFVLVQHLDPHHKSLLVELLDANSSMPVVTATDGVAVKENCVYVIPPDATLTIENGVLRLATPAPARLHRRPIDSFLVSLAEDQGECAVGIILSGVGSDGSLGIRAIKEHGGLTLAQAEFDSHALPGMPQNAATTGMVDQVMAVEAMPRSLIDYRGHLDTVAERKDSDGTRQDIREHLAEITTLLHAGVKHDFSGYKETTLIRRLQRRMQVLQLDDVSSYVDRLRTEPEESTSLFQEVLIGVTEFFRDPAAFEALNELAIKPMLATRHPDKSVRVWVPGCSTGEEVYSLAILLKEAANELSHTARPDIKIFGTDIDASAVSFARAGRYRRGATGLSPERLDRWFVEENGIICPLPEIREMCVFSAHSLVKDPPFSRLDLISCRNLLIYLDNDLQSRVTRTFHYALNPSGYLFLGTSESIGRHGNSFAILDKANRVLQRNDGGKSGLPAFESPTTLTRPPLQPQPSSVRPASTDDRIDKSVRRVMEQYAPAYFVIDRQHDILRFSGSEARHYLEPSPGAANLHLFSILHKTLRPAVRAAVQAALANQETVVTENLAIRIDGKSRALTLIVEPIIESAGKERGICVVAFRDASLFEGTAESDRPATTTSDAVTSLERELNATRFQLRVASDELETAVEDMKSTTEEFQAVNEELQSSNEELETAKEEMQSINEELQTVNGELASKNDLLTRLNNDLQNLLDSTQIATVFLDDDLRIRHFTPALTELFPLRDSDRGRPITEIVNLLVYEDLKRDVAAVQASKSVIDHEVALKDASATFLMRIRPYRTATNIIDGVVLTFVDITERKRDEEHKMLLAGEIQHRTQNLIAVIQSIAHRTLSGDRPLDVSREVFAARLKALAKAHSLIMTGVGHGAPLGEIVRAELASYSDRVAIDGPRVMLTPSATQGFALVIHELATNAAKHGALANGAGRLSVAWSHANLTGEPRLSFRWQERGGPPVTPPTRKGFGANLLERAFATLNPAEFNYDPEGLTYRMSVPLSLVCSEPLAASVTIGLAK
jgi:two-component system CheB/CheR fusion protein